jgi:hypothetical protein
MKHVFCILLFLFSFDLFAQSSANTQKNTFTGTVTITGNLTATGTVKSDVLNADTIASETGAGIPTFPYGFTSSTDAKVIGHFSTGSAESNINYGTKTFYILGTTYIDIFRWAADQDNSDVAFVAECLGGSTTASAIPTSTYALIFVRDAVDCAATCVSRGLAFSYLSASGSGSAPTVSVNKSNSAPPINWQYRISNQDIAASVLFCSVSVVARRGAVTWF